jgi:hypothetical protein
MFVNTNEFRRESIGFLKNGYYTNAPEGTFSYKEYWDEQRRRLQEGYEVGGVKITGMHYGYLNFCQINRTKSDDTTKGRGRIKRVDFPDFYDSDFEYFWELDKARAAGEGMIVAKARRKGYSYKNAWIVAHQFTTVRDSVNIVAAYFDNYADNTVGMAVDNLNFLSKHTAFGRQRNPDRREFMKARFKETLANGTEVWSGYNSEIHKITFKDDPFKSIGKSCNLMLWEEAGKWPNLKKSFRFAEPTWMDGDMVVGLPIIFGTGGDMEGGTMDFAEMFYSPETYGLRAYDNRWDEGATKKCGLFIPDYMNKPGFMDADGNSNVEKAKEYELAKRKNIIETSRSTADLYAYVSQFPFTPKEAFRRIGGNIFPVELLQDQLAYLETDKHARDLGQVGRLKWSNGVVEWEPRTDYQAITNFPMKVGDSIEGAIEIWEHPEVIGGVVPHGLYIAGTDPYDMDQAEYSPSLGSTFIYKRLYSVDRTYHWPVAEYTGRPENASDYYENVRMLLTYYNAQSLYENEKKGIFQYFQTKYCTHLLAEQPHEMIKEIIKDSKVQRGKGIHMTTGIKRYCEILLRDWLREEYAEGKRNLNKIYSKALLSELIAYNSDEGNYDRVIAFMMAILHNLSLFRVVEVEESRKELDPFWTTSLFVRK